MTCPHKFYHYKQVWTYWIFNGFDCKQEKEFNWNRSLDLSQILVSVEKEWHNNHGSIHLSKNNNAEYNLCIHIKFYIYHSYQILYLCSTYLGLKKHTSTGGLRWPPSTCRSPSGPRFWRMLLSPSWLLKWQIIIKTKEYIGKWANNFHGNREVSLPTLPPIQKITPKSTMTPRGLEKEVKHFILSNL